MEEQMSWKKFSLKRFALMMGALMLILLSASGCTPDIKEIGELQSEESDTLDLPTVDSGSLIPEETGETPAQTEKSSASGTDVVWTPFV